MFKLCSLMYWWYPVNGNEHLILSIVITLLCAAWSTNKPRYNKRKIIYTTAWTDATEGKLLIHFSGVAGFIQPCFRHLQYSCLGASFKFIWLESQLRETLLCKAWFTWLILALCVRMNYIFQEVFLQWYNRSGEPFHIWLGEMNPTHCFT